jgi:hypothetical protein
MSSFRHQTVKLSKGRHGSPQDGMCVLELASVLAGERFSDHPRTVCPVISSVLRSYNDALDDERRQSLIPYASHVVGTRGSVRVQERRAEMIRSWIAGRPRGRFARLVGRLWRADGSATSDSIGSQAIRALGAHGDVAHAELLALVDALIATRELPGDAAVPAAVSCDSGPATCEGAPVGI